MTIGALGLSAYLTIGALLALWVCTDDDLDWKTARINIALVLVLFWPLAVAAGWSKGGEDDERRRRH